MVGNDSLYDTTIVPLSTSFNETNQTWISNEFNRIYLIRKITKLCKSYRSVKEIFMFLFQNIKLTYIIE